MQASPDQMRAKILSFCTQSTATDLQRWITFSVAALAGAAIFAGLSIFVGSLRGVPMVPTLTRGSIYSSMAVMGAALLVLGPLKRSRGSLFGWLIAPSVLTYLLWQSAALRSGGSLDQISGFAINASLLAAVSGGLGWLLGIGAAALVRPQTQIQAKEKHHGPYQL